MEFGDSRLQQVTEVSLAEFLGRPSYPCVLRGVPVSEYSNLVVERVAKMFTSEAELLATFKGTKLRDMAFSALSGCSCRYEGLYPEPLEDNYIKANAGLDRDDIGQVALLANGGLAWTASCIWNRILGEQSLANCKERGSCGSSLRTPERSKFYAARIEDHRRVWEDHCQLPWRKI